MIFENLTSFTSLLFLPFVFVVALLYFTVFRKAQWFLLLMASLFFYICSGPKYIVYVLITALTTYLLGLRIETLHGREKRKTSDGRLTKDQKKSIKKKYTSKRKFYLIVDFIINIGMLAVIKYADFALTGVSALLNKYGIDWSKEFNFVLPLGISFYTFMTIGYILDVYWKRYEAEKNPLKMLLFATYFPHILQGPIARYNKLMPQFGEEHKFDYERVAKGLQLMLWGYFEKMVIADRLSIFATSVYEKWESANALTLLIAISFFSMKLYLDFQGCMDIGRGISQVFGIELERNFWHPYFSKNMPEFWRRWHITLGAWFKDYLLYPVSMSGLCKSLNRFTRKHWGNAVSRALSTIIPATCVWLITGVWHGAAMCYVLWGIYHGILIISGSVFEIPIQKLTKALHINTECFSFNLFRMIRTFTLSAIGRIFFVATAGFAQAIAIIKRTFDFSNFGINSLFDESLYNYGLDRYEFILSILLIFLVWAVSMLQERMCIRDEIAKQNIVFRWIIYLIPIAGIFVWGIYGSGFDASAFVYGQF